MLVPFRPHRPQAGNPPWHRRNGRFDRDVRYGQILLDYDHHKMRRRRSGGRVFVRGFHRIHF